MDNQNKKKSDDVLSFGLKKAENVITLPEDFFTETEILNQNQPEEKTEGE